MFSGWHSVWWVAMFGGWHSVVGGIVQQVA